MLPEVAALLDDTDARADEARRLLRGQGVGAPITAVVAVTCNPGMTRTWKDVLPANGLVADDLPATIVLGAAYVAKFQYRPGQAPRAVPMRFATP